MALFGNGKRVEALQRELGQLRDLIPDEVFQGETVESPYITRERPSRLPWRRQVIEAAAVSTPTKAIARAGYMADIPRGGANEFNQGYTQVGGVTDRRTLMNQMQMLYMACTPASACVDVISRTSSAGGLTVVPDDESNQRDQAVVLSPQAQKAQDLIAYVNPYEDIRQLLRGIFADLLIYGDSFIEVVWALGEPIALFSLPCPDMLIDADEHGDVNFYIQRTETEQRAKFEPHQVIHIKFDSPRGGLYGLGPTEKSVHPITTWLFTEGLLKSTMQRGNPPNVAFSWDMNLADSRIKIYSEKYASRNIGPDNVGNPIDLIGDTPIHVLGQNKIAEYLSTLDLCRDQTFTGYGVPPSKAAVIESGNLGGGTGTSQDKMFRVNTCGPVEDLVLEKLTFHILRQGFGVTDYRYKLGEVDWRDDLVIEQIRDLRFKNGTWTGDRYRDDIGEPPVPGGDKAVIVQRTGVVLVEDLDAMSKAAIAKANGVAEAPGSQPGPEVEPVVPTDTGAPDNEPPAHAKDGPKESLGLPALDFESDLAERFEADWQSRYTKSLTLAVAELSEDD